MRRTTDIAEVIPIYQSRFGPDWEMPDNVVGMFLSDDSTIAIIIMPLKRKRSYTGHICSAAGVFDPVAMGKHMDQVAHWMFLNTNAILIRSWSPAANTQLTQALKQSRAIIDESDPERVVNTYTIARWAKLFGPRKAINALRANGRNAKANRLQTAYDNWLARQ